MTQTSDPNSILHNERWFNCPPRKLFEAFEKPDRLARWWGPSGFTNTFEVFEFKPGGRWIFVMHAPNGDNYPNECVFLAIEPDSRIVIEHLLEPWFELTIVFTTQGARTHLSWDQKFASPEIAAKYRPLCETANEQNLDRLQLVLLNKND